MTALSIDSPLLPPPGIEGPLSIPPPRPGHPLRWRRLRELIREIRLDKEDAANHTFIEKSFGCSLQTQAQCEGCMVKSDRAARCPPLWCLFILWETTDPCLPNCSTPGRLYPTVTPAQL